jgi:hypothetical protein
MTKRVLSLVATVVLAGATLLVIAPPAGAATVTTEAELRDAFANDTQVDLAADITLTDCTAGDGGSVVRANTNTDPVTVDGHGFTITQTCASNVLVQNSTAGMTVRNLTVTGGNTDGSGAGLFSIGDLTVEDSVLTGNRADAAGGGAATDGVLVVRRSSVVGNSSGEGGGGLQGNLDVTVVDSDVSENVNGGIATSPAEDAHMTVINSTVHHNTLAGLGGGIFSGGDLTLVYVTVTDNTANQAFQSIDAGTMSAFGSVITDGTGAVNCEVADDSVSLGYNFSDDDTCGLHAPTDRVNAGDPHLGALAANGGPTQTQLPLAGSPLVDAIPAAACAPDVTTDQRGVTRPQGGFCDIGAVELEVVTPLVPLVPVVVTPRFTG